jgi:4-amino-4-deoxy-L-arabinose transferase-like glycosyltransferase
MKMSSFSIDTRVGFAARLMLLMALATLLFLAGNNRVGLFDRDEPWYAEISREMVQSGDWVVPRFLGGVFLGKPVLSFWYSAASITAFGDTPFAVRLPSAIGTIGTMLLLALVIAKFVGKQRAIWSALILGTSLLTIVLSKICITDAVLLPFVTAAQLALYAIYRNRGGWVAVFVLWLSVGLAVLSKGPVVVGIQGATVVALMLLDVGAQWKSPKAWRNAMNWWLRTRPWLGVFLIAAVVLPWAIEVEQREPGFLARTWVRNMYGPIVKASLEGHGGPPGYYLMLVWPMFLPWSLFLPLAMLQAWSNRRLAPVRFALAAVIGPWVLIELVKQKLPHYLFPLFPALAFLTADALVRAARGNIPGLRRQLRGGLACWAVVAAIAGFIPFVGAYWTAEPQDLPWASMWILGLGMTLYSATVVVLFMRRKPTWAAGTMGVGMAVAAVFAYTSIMPELQFMRLSPRSAQLLLAHGATAPGSDVGTLIAKRTGGGDSGYKEPSLAYYLGGKLQVLDADLLNQPSDRWPCWLVMTEEIWNESSVSAQSHLERVATFRGLNYGGSGRKTCIVIARTKPSSTGIGIVNVR